MELQSPSATDRHLLPVMLRFHHDPGHGWLEVPVEMLHALGIADKISIFSYRRNTTAFLEEDDDATLFTEACKARGIALKIENHHTNNDSFVRRLPQYWSYP